MLFLGEIGVIFIEIRVILVKFAMLSEKFALFLVIRGYFSVLYSHFDIFQQKRILHNFLFKALDVVFLILLLLFFC